MTDDPSQSNLPTGDMDLADLAIKSVLEQIPSAPTEELTDVQRQQPWAEKIAPQSTTGKRSLEELIDEYRERIAKDPEAKVHLPQTPSPGESYLQRFSRGGGGQPQGQPGGGRRHRSRGRGRGNQGQGPRPQGQAPAPGVQAQGSQPQPGGARRHRRRRRGPRPGGNPPPAS